jgi:predicted transcriptional regulator
METREYVRTTIELPAELNAKLCAEAAKTKRSRHAQMLFALEKFFETPVDNGKKETKK